MYVYMYVCMHGMCDQEPMCAKHHDKCAYSRPQNEGLLCNMQYARIQCTCVEMLASIVYMHDQRNTQRGLYKHARTLKTDTLSSIQKQ
jgi:hypothetical protein